MTGTLRPVILQSLEESGAESSNRWKGVRYGLVTRSRDAQRRPVHLDPSQLEEMTAWIDRYRLQHEEQYRRLDAVLENMKKEKRK